MVCWPDGSADRPCWWTPTQPAFCGPMTLSASEISPPLVAAAVEGGVTVKWMTEDGEPTWGLTLSPVALPGGVAVPEPVVVVAGVLGVVAVGGGAGAARGAAGRVGALRAAGEGEGERSDDEKQCHGQPGLSTNDRSAALASARQGSPWASSRWSKSRSSKPR